MSERSTSRTNKKPVIPGSKTPKTTNVRKAPADTGKKSPPKVQQKKKGSEAVPNTIDSGAKSKSKAASLIDDYDDGKELNEPVPTVESKSFKASLKDEETGGSAKKPGPLPENDAARISKRHKEPR